MWLRLSLFQNPRQRLGLVVGSVVDIGRQGWKRTTYGAGRRWSYRYEDGSVTNDRDPHARMSLETESQDRNDDEKYRQRRHDLQRHRSQAM